MKRKHKIYFILFTFLLISCKEKPALKESSLNKNKEFKCHKKKPIEGKTYGVVELGATGFNSFIVEVDKNSNWKINHSDFGTSLLIEGMTNTMLINQKLQEYLENLSNYGVLPKDIRFVVSSGAIKEEITTLIIEELKNLGHKIDSVNPQEEGELSLKAILPDKFKEKSFVVDLGSGNTKISYLNDNSIVSIETIGAKYYQKGIEDIEVYNKVKEAISKVPLEKREKCFIIGGIPWEMSKLVSKEEKDCIVLTANVDAYAKGKGKKFKSGLNIFKAIQEETKVKQTIFVKNGNFAIGFLLNQIGLVE